MQLITVLDLVHRLRDLEMADVALRKCRAQKLDELTLSLLFNTECWHDLSGKSAHGIEALLVRHVAEAGLA